MSISAPIELIAATTAAAQSSGFTTIRTRTVMARGLAGAETVTLQQSDDGTNWYDVILDGVTQELSVTHTLLTIIGPGHFRMDKSATVASVSVVAYDDSSSR